MNNDNQENARGNSERYGRLKRHARLLGGYALGWGGVAFVGGGLIGGPAAAVVGGAIGGGMLYASREVLRPIYEPNYSQTEQPPQAEQAQPQESRWRKLGRGLAFAGGMALHYMGASLLGSALFSDGVINTAGERLVAGGLGVASVLAGSHFVDKSYDPNLFQAYDEAQEQSRQQPAAA